MTTGSIPSIDQMTVTRYDLSVSVFPMMCVVENQLKFKHDDHSRKDHMEVDVVDSAETDEGTLQAKFVYPLYGGARINKFVAHIIPTDPTLSAQEVENGTRIISAIIQEKSAARLMFEMAKRTKQPAVMATLDEAAPDCFICQLGAIPLNHDVNCEFSYFMELSPVESAPARSDESARPDKVRTLLLQIPMSYKTRYVTNGSQQPELNERPIDLFHRSISIKAQNCQLISGKTTEGENRIVHRDTSNEDKWTLDNRQLNATVEDIELYVQLKTDLFEHGEFITAFEYNPSKKEAVFAVHVTPTPAVDCVDTEPGPKEYHLLVDRSGSMNGRSIARAKEALKMLLNQLPPDNTKFNIISFGSRYTRLWDRAREYNDDNLATALSHVDEMDANYGGTDILSPLKDVIGHTARCPRDIILLTDGSVGNTREILEYVRTHKDYNRVWGVGIGDGCSTALVNGVAEASNAVSIFVKNEDRMNSKMMQLAKSTLRSRLRLTRVALPQLAPDQIKIVGLNGKGFDAIIALSSPVWLYYKMSGLKQKHFDQLKSKTLQLELTFTLGNTKYREVKKMSFVQSENSGLLAYYASQEINLLTRHPPNGSLKRMIINLSVEANILTSYTAFIGCQLNPFTVTIEADSAQSDQFPLSVKHSETVREMKEKINLKLGCAVKWQELALDGMILRDSETVLMSNIQTKSKLSLKVVDHSAPFTIFIKTDTGRKVPLEVARDTTLHTIKMIVQAEITRVPYDSQRMVTNGKMIVGNELTMDQLNITEGTMIHLVMQLRGSPSTSAQNLSVVPSDPTPGMGAVSSTLSPEEVYNNKLMLEKRRERYGSRRCVDDVQADHFQRESFQMSPNSFGARSNQRYVHVPAAPAPHVRLVGLSKIKGNWEDVDEVWDCITSYQFGLTKEAIIAIRKVMPISAFVTIVVLYVLNRYAKDVKIEWEIKANQSAQYLISNGVTDEHISAIHLKLDNIVAHGIANQPETDEQVDKSNPAASDRKSSTGGILSKLFSR